jgi:murein DD-endopeptidase MepM/ murein hydrolase activator NlpD
MSYETNQSGPYQVDDPLAGKGELTGYFGEKRATHFHAGIDEAAVKGTHVFAADSGVVTHAGYGHTGYGQYIDIEDPTFGAHFRYAHLDEIASGVGPGVAVGRAQLIGFVGNTGTQGFHLHFEVTVGSTPYDPLYFLPTRSLP